MTTKPILLAIEYRYSVKPDEILTGEDELYKVKDKLVEGVAEHLDKVHAPISINNEENELIKALREI